jgi:hypothetical protein
MQYAIDDAMRVPMKGAMDGALRRAFRQGLSPQITSKVKGLAAGH